MIFLIRQKFNESIGVFLLKLRLVLQKFDDNIGFWEKRQFFRSKLAKIAENCDHDIDPWIQLSRTNWTTWTNLSMNILQLQGIPFIPS
jgi:hypothetical protein